MSRVEAFLAAVRPPTPEWPELAETLTALISSARAAWPSLALEEAVFVAHLGARLPAPARAALEAVQAEDLYLACACATGVPQALMLFETHVLPRADPVIRRCEPSDAFLDEVRQQLRQKLFLDPPRIAEFTGQGSLVAWLRTVAARTALNTLRPDARHERAELDELEALPLAGPDPELALLRGRHRSTFRAAFQTALAELPMRERTALKLNALDGVSLEKIGAMYGVDKSSVSRWLSHAHTQLLDGTRAALRVRLSLQSDEVESLMNALQSQLASSLVHLLNE